MNLTDQSTHSVIDKDVAVLPSSQSSTPSNHYILCSQQITSNKRLLVLMEQHYQMAVISHSYDVLKGLYNKAHQNKFHMQPDILIDERTGVFLLDFMSLVEAELVKVKDKALSCCMKLTKCYIIIAHTSKDTE